MIPSIFVNSIVLINCLNFILINSATFENVEITLTERQQIYSDADVDIRVPISNRKVLIESDDSLGKYIRNETVLKIIEIFYQNIPKLTTNSIDNLPITTDLIMNWCGLKEIEPGTFKNIPKLETIDFDGNELEVIRNDVFTGLDVKFVYLQNNKISTVEDRAFNNMKLQHLHFYRNQLTKWNSDWLNGSPVDRIYFGYNSIEELPENSFNFLKKQQFYHADFAFNKIRKIATGAFKNIGLFDGLNLRNNLIEQLQNGVFYGIKNLSNLQLENNNISYVGEDIFEADARIRSFDLNNNKLASFPMKPLKNHVQNLWVEDNPITCGWIKEIEKSLKNEDGFATVWFDKAKKHCVN